MRTLLAGAALAVAACALTPAAAMAAPQTATCTPSFFAERYEGKTIHIIDRCQSEPGWVRYTVFINGRELGVDKLEGDMGYLSVINAYDVTPTLKDTARNAVDTLGPDGELAPFRP
ncbi:hypothetical protein [Alloactinosynnema sp. L-07]|uniref:tyrosinase family oxidase copper chaperone n=1 Tax=Alloactinosynnema sp. L-07 TaxID=1653480 RepID=UPI00065F0AE9|nr:tyrosinase family oxidase copper chaperone [Alloactinosynnema sp. L-07]CRK61637.1 hypothetical protein [Alloactinosynnema sp. L-07]